MRHRLDKMLPVETGVALVLLVSTLWLARTFPEFRTGANAATILNSYAATGILAAGMTLVIATGGIDISVGSIVGLSGVVLGILSAQHGWGLWPASVAAVAAGGVCGLLNGLLIARFSLPPIIATLATFSGARAAAYVLSHGNSISGVPPALIDLGYSSVFGLPPAVWVAIATLIAAGVVLKRTRFGRSLLAFGGNREAAALSGIPTRRIEISVYVISGLLAGVASLLVTALGASAVPDAGRGQELTAITAVVMGGTPVVGGSATMSGTALGVLAVGVVANGVRTYGKDDIWVQIVMGAILLLSIEVDRWRRKRMALA